MILPIFTEKQWIVINVLECLTHRDRILEIIKLGRKKQPNLKLLGKKMRSIVKF